MADLLKSRRGRLSAFLADSAGREFCYGVFDCALMPANWCQVECGIDPAASVRDLYDSDQGWQTLAESAARRRGDRHGLIALWGELGVISGLARTATPHLGDIGLVRVPGYGVFGAIHGDNRWLVKLNRGLVGADFKFLIAWAVPCRKR